MATPPGPAAPRATGQWFASPPSVREGDPAPSTAPEPVTGWERLRTWPLSVVAMAVAVAVGVIKVMTTFGRPFFFYGDEAVLGLRVIDATHLQAVLGPYSRYGWSHPGPALFYLIAPLYRFSGSDPRALTAGALLINGLCLVGAVGVVRRFAGEWSARWSVAVVSIAVLALGLNFFEYFWNPTVEASAVLLSMVLTAAAVSGSGLSVVWLAVVGTYVVQTDVGTLPLIGFLAVVAVIGWVVQAVARSRREAAQALAAVDDRTPARRVHLGGSRLAEARAQHRQTTRWVLGAVGVVGVILLWIPPVHQQLTGHPGNLWALWHFFTSPTPASVGHTHSLADAWSMVANATTSVPWGNPTANAVVTTAAIGREATVVVWAGLSLATVVWGALRRRWFAVGLGVTTLGGLVVAVISAERIVGPVAGYLTYWMALLPIPGLVAVGDLAIGELGRVIGRRQAGTLERAPRHARPTTRPVWHQVGAWVLAVVLVVPALVVAWQWAPGTGSLASAGDPEIGQLASFATTHLAATPGADVHVVIGNADRWPEAAGLVFQLRREGYHPTVDPLWGFLFTPRMVSSGTGKAQLVLTDGVAGTAPTAASVTVADGDVPTTITYVPATGAG